MTTSTESTFEISMQEKERETVERSLGILAKTLNVPVEDLKAVNKDLPITPRIVSSNFMLVGGYVDVTQDPGGHPQCDMVFIETQNPVIGVHESIHALHLGANSDLAKKRLAEKQEEKRIDEKADGPTHFAAQATLQTTLGIEQAATNRLDIFSKRTGLKAADVDSLSQSDLNEVIRQRLRGVSGVQLIQLQEELTVNSLTDKNMTEYLELYHYTDLTGELDEMDLALIRTHKAESMETAADALSEEVERIIKVGNLDVAGIKSIFDKAGIPMGGAIVRDMLLKKTISSLSKEEQLAALQKYLESGMLRTKLEAGVALYILPLERRLQLNNRGDEIALDEMEELRREAIKAITERSFDLENTDLEPVLKSLIDNEIGKADAETTLESDALIFFGDLPDEEEARSRLLGNKRYVSELVKAIMGSEASPLIQAIGMSPETFALNTVAAQQSVKESAKSVFRNPSDVDISSFVARERSNLSIKTCWPGNDLARIEAGYWDFQFRVTEKTSIEHPDWNPQQIDDEVKRVLVSQAEEIVGDKSRDGQTEKNLMNEPIAHVLTNMATGHPIRYEGGIMGFGAYADTLSAQNLNDPESAINEWHAKIRKMLEKVQKEGKLDRLMEFFRANSLEEQQKVLAKYARP